jgi:3-oxoadipate enol-lactonase
MMTWTAKAAVIDHGRIPYLDAGDPRSPHVLLLIHAFPVGMRMWEPVNIPDGWRAVAPALPGFDGADPPPRDSTRIDDYADVVLQFMAHLRLDSAVIGGVSMGGYVAFASWRLDRLRWRGFVLADTRAGADSEQARAGREKMLQALAARGSRGVADEALRNVLGSTTRAHRPQIVDDVRRMIERQTNEGLRSAVVRLRDRPDSTPLLREIGVPVLLMVGEEDEVTPPAEADQMRAQLEDVRLVRLPQAGHLSCLENPAAFNATLAAFLNEIRG